MNGYSNIFLISRPRAPVSLTVPLKLRIPPFSMMWQLLVTRPAQWVSFHICPGEAMFGVQLQGHRLLLCPIPGWPPLSVRLSPSASLPACNPTQTPQADLHSPCNSLSLHLEYQQWRDISTGPLSLAFFSPAPDRVRVAPNWPRAVPRGLDRLLYSQINKCPTSREPRGERRLCLPDADTEE